MKEEVYVCNVSSKKPFEDYRMITDVSSKQYQLINSNRTIVREDGLLIIDGEYIGVALGSAYGEIGSKYTMITDTGKEFKVIKVDEKSDNHTTNGCYDSKGAIVEFVVDMDKAMYGHANAMRDGDFNSTEEFNGQVVQMYKEE